MERSEKWFLQAQDDLEWLRDTLKSGHHAQACFIAQQVGEKALKALAYARGGEVLKTHSIFSLAKALRVGTEIENAGKILDQYYITTRYPDALPDGYPGEYFTEEQAGAAELLAVRILTFVRLQIHAS